MSIYSSEEDEQIPLSVTNKLYSTSEGKTCWWGGGRKEVNQDKGIGGCEGGSKLQCYNRVRKSSLKVRFGARLEDKEAAKNMPITILNG